MKGQIRTPWKWDKETVRFDADLTHTQDWIMSQVQYPVQVVSGNATIEWRQPSTPTVLPIGSAEKSQAAITIDFEYLSTGEYSAAVDWQFELDLSTNFRGFGSNAKADLTVQVLADLQTGPGEAYPDPNSLVVDIDVSALMLGVVRRGVIRQDDNGVFRLAAQIVGHLLPTEPWILRIGFRYKLTWTSGTSQTIFNHVTAGVDALATVGRNLFQTVLAADYVPDDQASAASDRGPDCEFVIV